jgi:hypothetical protein
MRAAAAGTIFALLLCLEVSVAAISRKKQSRANALL